jgi:hypothetical protein
MFHLRFVWLFPSHSFLLSAHCQQCECVLNYVYFLEFVDIFIIANTQFLLMLCGYLKTMPIFCLAQSFFIYLL